MEPMVIMPVSDLKELIRQVIQEEQAYTSGEVMVEKLLTVDQVAEILGRHPKYIYKIKHRIGFIKEGSGIRFKASALKEYQDKHHI